MFNNKKINELKDRITLLEDKIQELARLVTEQAAEIDKVFLLFEQQAAVNAQKPEPEQKQQKKKCPHFKPRKKNGEKAAEDAE